MKTYYVEIKDYHQFDGQDKLLDATLRKLFCSLEEAKKYKKENELETIRKKVGKFFIENSREIEIIEIK